MRLGLWSRTAAQNTETPPNGAPENWAPSAVNNWARETMDRIREWYEEPEWLDLISENGADWPTFTTESTTVFEVAGTDFTAKFVTGRRVKCVGDTTVYGYVVSSALDGSDTDVTMNWDGAGVTPANITEVWVGPLALKDSAYTAMGSGNGLDADTVDGIEASALTANFGKNFITNGRMNVAQRGTSFTSPAGAYTLDRWRADVDGGTGAVSQQDFTLGQTDVPDEPEHYLRYQLTGAGTNPVLVTRIEDVRTAAGQAVTFSAYMKADASRSVTASIKQNFGTGGTPTSESTHLTTGSWNLTTSWVRQTLSLTMDSISGSLLGTNGDDYVELHIAMPSGVTFTIDIADAQFELGASASSIDQRPIADELYACKRFFQRYEEGITGGGLAVVVLDNETPNGQGSFHFEQEMRDAPTLAISAAGSATACNGLTLTEIGTRSALINPTQSGNWGQNESANLRFVSAGGGTFDLDAEL
jgi:hypothetical protein